MKPKTATKPRSPRTPRPSLDVVDKERAALDTLRRIHDTGIILDVEASGLQHPEELIEADEFMQSLYGKKTRYWALRAKAIKEGDVVKRMGDSIVEIAAIRAFDGKELFHSYVRPVEKFNPVAKDLLLSANFDFNAAIRAPEWPEVWQGLLDATRDDIAPNAVWSGWNAEFDNRMVAAMGFRYNLPQVEHPLIQWCYAMRSNAPKVEFHNLFPCVDALTPYAEFTKTQRGSRSLVKCMQHAGIKYRGTAHGALSDCHAVRELLLSVLTRFPANGGKK